MITNVKIENVATYKNIDIYPKQINYIYGSNGTGKTTLSKILNNPAAFTSAEITFDGESETITYNKDFVDQNFSNNSAIKGIFTIGKDSKEIEEQIQQKLTDKLKLEDEKEKLENSEQSLTNEAKEEKNNFEEACWLALKSNEQFKECFKGCLNSKEVFAKKCQDFFSVKCNDQINLFLNDYKILYSEDLKTLEEFNLFEIEKIKELEENEIFKTSIVCLNNNKYSELINSIKNSDWVKKGIDFIGNIDVCPFCQQKMSEKIKESLLEVFDQTYEKQINSLSLITKNYKNETEKIVLSIESICNNSTNIIDVSRIQSLNGNLTKILQFNNEELIKKEINPSGSIALKSTVEILTEINKEICEFNEKIRKNNNIARNKEDQKKLLNEKVWNCVVNNILYDTIDSHNKKMEGINRGEEKLKDKIFIMSEKIQDLEIQIKELQAKVSTIDNAINEINKILLSFSFTGFKLVKSEDNRNYKIVRPDGSEVQKSLSEGEQRFITFLYFYELVKGNIDSKNSLKRKIIVIDDPVSSLDSNIVFIITTLIREIISDCLSDKGLVKQVFVLTHNIYFHKEIAFKGNRKNISQKKESFWLIKKKDNISDISTSSENPIKTTYELMWDDVRNLNKASPATIFNTLRRILEYYFNIIGDIDYEKCINEMEGEDKILCKSLLSLININSHNISDDFYVIDDEETLSKYIKVFERIFEITGQKAHYDMMMRIH